MTAGSFEGAGPGVPALSGAGAPAEGMVVPMTAEVGDAGV
jgi:hypothetical protein